MTRGFGGLRIGNPGLDVCCSIAGGMAPGISLELADCPPVIWPPGSWLGDWAPLSIDWWTRLPSDASVNWIKQHGRSTNKIVLVHTQDLIMVLRCETKVDSWHKLISTVP